MSVNIVILHYVKNTYIQLYKNLFPLQEGGGGWGANAYIYPDVFSSPVYVQNVWEC